MDAFLKAGFITNYTYILLLYVWGLEDVPESTFIPQEIAKDVTAICIVDNDFKMAGYSRQAHRTNVMFVQHQKHQA